MISDSASAASFRCTIAPWLSVHNGARAVDFYTCAAFGANEVYRPGRSQRRSGGQTLCRWRGVLAQRRSLAQDGNFSRRVLRRRFGAYDPHRRRSGCCFRASGQGGSHRGLSRRRGTWLALGPRGRSFRVSLGNWPSGCRLGVRCVKLSIHRALSTPEARVYIHGPGTTG